MSNDCSGFNPQVGEMCWHEVPVVDVKRAADFYSAVLGWDIELKGMPSPYESVESVHMFNKGSTNGALIRVSDEALISKDADPTRPAKGGALTTFKVENIAETLKKVEASGGKCHIPRTDIGNGMGFCARFIDTEGNLQGIWAKE